ncbi:MAG: ABC transporter permease [Clostridiales bacterium]|nr:ABC transporter permease [Clostridiales bacterium]
MASTTVAENARINKSSQKQSFFLITLKRLKKNKLAMVGLFFMIFMILVSVFAPFIAPYSYEEQNLSITFQTPNKEHLMGTDNLGRDILSRIIYGGRMSLRIGIIAVAIASAMGIFFGSIAGYYGGKTDNIIMRVLDIFQAVPPLLMAIAIAAALGPGIMNAMIAIGISTTPAFARITRASFLNVCGMEYIEAAKAINATDRRIIIKHVLPNAMSPILVEMTMGVAKAILIAASLSFIGLGAQPPLPEWGAMLSGGRNYIRDYWHIVLFPGVTIMLTVLSLNMLGDGLRDALDPRLKN